MSPALARRTRKAAPPEPGPAEPGPPASPDHRRTALLFGLVFFTFTQYDVFAFGKVNYLLFSVPLLLGLVVAGQFAAFRGLRFPKRTWPFLALYPLLGFWVLIAAEVIPLYNYVILAGVLLTAAMLVQLCRQWPKETDIALRAFIWVNIAALLFQVVWSSLAHTQIDLHNLLFPFSRNSQISALDGFGFLRFNGFQLEPGSYAANLGTATMLHYGITRRLSVPMIGMVLLTLLITRSASALLYFAVISLTAYAAALAASRRRTLLATPALAAVLAGLVYVSGFNAYIGNRFLDQNVQQIAQQDGSARYKLANIDRLLTADVDRQLVGSGFMRVDCDACGFVNSNGADFAMVFFFGVLGAGMVLALLGLGVSRSLGAFFLVLMLLLSRHTFVQPAFWVPVMFLIADREFFARRRGQP